MSWNRKDDKVAQAKYPEYMLGYNLLLQEKVEESGKF